MIRSLLILFMVIFFTGCETLNSSYYTDPASPGYQEQALGALCELCGKKFFVSAYHLNNEENVICPYDGHLQNVKYAVNRASYDAQQAQSRQFQQYLDARSQRTRERAQRSQQRVDEALRAIYNPERGSSPSRPIYVKPGY